MCPTKRNSVLLALFFSLVLLNVSGQDNNPLINSGEILKAGNTLHDNKEYQKAISEYQKINRSDTNYADAIYELSYSYYADSQFNKSLEYANLGMKLFPHKFSTFSMQAANCLDEPKKPDEALLLYDSALKRNPYSAILYFNKGIVNYRFERYDEAKKNFQQCLLINPYYTSAHYFLGNTFLFNGNLVAALLSYNTYLLIAPDGKYSANCINTLSSISKVSDEIVEYTRKKNSSREDNFNVQQEILLSKIALDSKYKLKADLEDNIVRQIQVVHEKLEYNKNDKGFCMQFYVPFYVNMMKKDHFEAMIFTMFSGVENKTITNWNKENKKRKQAFLDEASPYFDLIKSSQILDPSQRESASVNFVYEDGRLIGKGMLTKDKDPHVTGKWEYFYESGALKAKGVFNEKGEKEGEWNYYYENGQLKEKSNMLNGEATGLSEGWFDNGNKWYTEQYSNGKTNGKQTSYYYNGNLRTITQYKDGKKEGEQRYYDTKGQLSTIENLSDDKLNGLARNYHPNGNLKNEMNYVNDEEDGTYKSYYPSGKLNQQGNMEKGKRQGLWTTYYESGGISEKTVYLDNEITGEFTEYYENGQLSSKGTYYKKKIDGKTENYDDDGKIFSDATYEKGRLREINFYDKNGKLISTTTTRRGAANIVFYNAQGFKSQEGYFNKDGYKDGKFTSYYNSGQVSEESNWKEGVKQGSQVTYYPNGKVKETKTFIDGEEDGYVKDYYINGQLNSEGWKVKDKRQQSYLYYNAVGDLTAREYFLNDELQGYSEFFEPKRKVPTSEYKYDNGWIESIIQYDSTGATLCENKFAKGSGPLIYKYPDKKKSSEGAYQHYYLEGPYTYYYFDGSLSAEGFFRNNERDSTYKSYYYGGVLAIEGKYNNGEKTGAWKYYYENGKKREEENYVEGKLNGENKLYLSNGSLDKILHYKDNELDSTYDMFSEKNQLILRFNYKDGYVKSYQYEEKPGIFCNPIPIPGGNGKVLAKYPNGQQSAVLTFADNNLQGERKLYYPDGKLYTDGNRLGGFNDGSFKCFYPTGTIWKEENYVLGNLHGLCKYYYTNGKLEKEENYYADELHGVCRYYDEQGKLKQTRVYHYGSLVSVK